MFNIKSLHLKVCGFMAWYTLRLYDERKESWYMIPDILTYRILSSQKPETLNGLNMDFFSLPPSGNHYSALCLWESDALEECVDSSVSFHFVSLFHLDNSLPGSSICRISGFPPTQCWILFHCADRPHFVYLIIYWWHWFAFAPWLSWL